MNTELITIDAESFAIADKKGRRVSFERAVAFASKDDRVKLAQTMYRDQVAAGNYGRLIRDALAAGLLTKSQSEIVTAMLAAGGRMVSKATAAAVCQVILAAWADKADKADKAKGQKLYYLTLIRELAKALAMAPTGDVIEA